ncbi:hypothetical protein BDQ12DRAFT_674344 [Crucibulum laeve]|uniref:JmjC domain-containing protein n=1 Tax=Crucibulum laeve TaxID=68775 RepID=A0A5C3MCC8_9AGAR|nr:hypothetical protein BDQ12DRAFT_674344 [Crucibulum laeve]
MNSFQDPSKKTSITSLLNPQEASAFPAQLPGLASVNANPGQPHDPVAVYGVNYGNPSTYHLRAASWENSDPNDTARRKENAPNRHYHHPGQMSSSDTYHAPRVIRERIEDGQYAVESQAWDQQQQQDVASMPYGSANILGPIYSDERTAISGDYQSHNSYNQGYQEQSTSDTPSQTAWQTTERASVRLAARGSTAEPSQHAPDARYNNSVPYYPQANAYNVPYLQQAAVHPQARQAAPAPPPAPERQNTSPSSSKRSAAESEPVVPVKKKARTAKKTSSTTAASGADGTAGPSRRGYNAKKRSEAAQIAAQNAQLMPTLQFTQVPSDKGKEKASDNTRMQIVSTNGQQPATSGASGEGGALALHPELQFARCMSNRYRNEQFPRCVSCTRRWAGDTCRFQGIRFFLKDVNKNIVGISFVESQKPDGPGMTYQTKWNIPLKKEHISRTKKTIARALLPTLRKELEHLNMPEIIRRPRESEVRATCDTCMTSLFSSSWMCRLCGREACAECFTLVQELTVDKPNASPREIAQQQLRRDQNTRSNPFFLSCTRRNEHQAKDFSPMSRFYREELESAIAEMEEEIGLSQGRGEPKGEGGEDTGGTVMNGGLAGQGLNGHGTNGVNGMNGLHNVMNGLHHGPNGMNGTSNGTLHNGVPTITSESSLAGAVPLTPVASNGSYPPPQHPSQTPPLPHSSATPAYTPPNLLDSITATPSHPILRYADSDLSTSSFSRLWSQGVPLVVTGVLDKFSIKWTPEYFIEKYGEQTCLIIECQTDMNKRVTVGEFFGWFGAYDGRTECWKLKDWPPSADFKSTFPELFEDFSQAVPIPDYVRRDGVLNLGSHFPTNTIGPDLGPKMYNAMASTQSPGSKGTTKLHMDMADALNIMTFASPCPDNSPGCAAWDLFRAEDSDKLRQFLRQKFGGSLLHDPIHSQNYYLDEQLRAALWAEAGVMSYRVYQRPGEAVFIPAGCAHQVSNMADCVKVAIDYVSPENIERCEKLTKEFREQNQSMVWKEDVLQLRTMMWFAWLSCCQQEKGSIYSN